MSLIATAAVVLQVAVVLTSAGAAVYWYRAAVAPVPELQGLVGIANPPGILGGPLGGGMAVIMDDGPVNEIVAALRDQGLLNRKGALFAAAAAALQALSLLVGLAT